MLYQVEWSISCLERESQRWLTGRTSWKPRKQKVRRSKSWNGWTWSINRTCLSLHLMCRFIVRNKDNSTDFKRSRLNFYNPRWTVEFEALLEELASVQPLDPSALFTEIEMYVVYYVLRRDELMGRSRGYTTARMNQEYAIFYKACYSAKENKLFLHERKTRIREEGNKIIQSEDFYRMYIEYSHHPSPLVWTYIQSCIHSLSSNGLFCPIGCLILMNSAEFHLHQCTSSRRRYLPDGLGNCSGHSSFNGEYLP